MIAETTPVDETSRAETFVQPYHKPFLDALALAERMARTTATDAWQDGYQTNVKAHKAEVGACIETIRDIIDGIADGDTSEESEKDVRDSIKALADERVKHGAWLARAIEPYRAAVAKCAKARTKPISDAAEVEREAPLVSRGLRDDVMAIVDLWPVVGWNDDNGTIEIVDPATGEVK